MREVGVTTTLSPSTAGRHNNSSPSTRWLVVANNYRSALR
ncbi:hypothetical protein AVEN_269163-1, partial [Araneus ventricosus]